jgi:hypothetical protein
MASQCVADMVVVRDLFDEEIVIKAKELELIETKIFQTKFILQKIRCSLLKRLGDCQYIEISPNHQHELFVEPDQVKVNGNGSPLIDDNIHTKFGEQESFIVADCDVLCDNNGDVFSHEDDIDMSVVSNMISTELRSTVKRHIIVGNTSQFIKKLMRDNDATHKWMMYVRGDKHESNLESYVKNVTFFLHPTYKPNDIVVISKAPFQLMRFGWGEFPVRVQLQFIDPVNKPIDIIHRLKLDQTHCGDQMLGSETVIDVDLLINSTQQDYSQLEPDVEGNLLECPFPMQPQSPSISNAPSSMCFISLPVTDKKDITLLDHNYHTSVVVSKSNHHMNDSDKKKNSASLENSLVVSSSRNVVLHSIIKKFPLSNFGNEDTMNERCDNWKLIKKRAIEWMRGVAVRQALEQLEDQPRLTTRQIVRWCRYNGYTPLDCGFEFCKHCGFQINKYSHDRCITNTASINTFSEFDLMNEPSESDSSISGTACVEVDVDIVISNPLVHPKPDLLPIYRVPQQQELRWVNRTANKLGIILHPLTCENKLLHVVDHMIYSACTQFLCELLHVSVNMEEFANAGDSSERIIIPLHIYKSIKSIAHFDFLTGDSLGVLIK